jgi:hypothetical protein
MEPRRGPSLAVVLIVLGLVVMAGSVVWIIASIGR